MRRGSILPRVRLHAGILFVLLSWSAGARATPEFPDVVIQTLGLPKIEIDPPMGCTLCHTTDQGGTSLRTFGDLVQQYGAQPYQDDTLKQALAEVQQNEPQLIADIKAGTDPNDDTSASSLPTPEYGCAITRVGRSRSQTPELLVAAAFAAVLLRSFRPRRRPRPR